MRNLRKFKVKLHRRTPPAWPQHIKYPHGHLPKGPHSASPHAPLKTRSQDTCIFSSPQSRIIVVPNCLTSPRIGYGITGNIAVVPHCTLPVQYSTVQWTPYTVRCAMYTVHCTLHTAHCTLYTVSCTLYTVNCTLYTVHCTVLKYCIVLYCAVSIGAVEQSTVGNGTVQYGAVHYSTKQYSAVQYGQVSIIQSSAVQQCSVPRLDWSGLYCTIKYTTNEGRTRRDGTGQ